MGEPDEYSRGVRPPPPTRCLPPDVFHWLEKLQGGFGHGSGPELELRRHPLAAQDSGWWNLGQGDPQRTLAAAESHALANPASGSGMLLLPFHSSTAWWRRCSSFARLVCLLPAGRLTEMRVWQTGQWRRDLMAGTYAVFAYPYSPAINPLSITTAGAPPPSTVAVGQFMWWRRGGAAPMSTHESQKVGGLVHTRDLLADTGCYLSPACLRCRHHTLTRPMGWYYPHMH
jgi:hypothetical protein